MPVTTVLTLAPDSQIRDGDLLRLEQAPTENARRRVGETVRVARVVGEPVEVDGRLDVPVQFLENHEGAEANVVIHVEAKR